MREIKFRGKTTFDNEWIYGFYYNMDERRQVARRHIIVFEDEESKVLTNHEPVIGETVGQYTGLKDKDDREIYEGDIVKFYSLIEDDFVIGEVSYHFGIFRMGDYMLVNHFRSCKVIGNVYENKDLLV
jgi:uncharacterized phage protein (TIGR01671 family)